MPIITSKQNPKIKQDNEQPYNTADLQPFLKWVGGKTQIIKLLMEQFPKTINGNYYEVFVGGGSVFLELIRRILTNKIKLKGDIYVNDINNNLINLYQQIKNNPENLVQEIKKFKDEYHNIEQLNVEKYNNDEITTKEAYYYVKRKRYNELKENNAKNKNEEDELERAVLFVFLNKTCWRGVYRENATGLFNVPFGNYNTISMYNERQIKSLHYCFNKCKFNVEFCNEDFCQFAKRIKNKNDFVYMDPPYFPNTLEFERIYDYEFINKKGSVYRFKKRPMYKHDKNGEPIPTGKSKKVFATYNKESFGLIEQKNLLKICQKLKKQKTKFMSSNSCAGWILEEYQKFNIEKIQCKRRINSKKPQDTDFEVIIK